MTPPASSRPPAPVGTTERLRRFAGFAVPFLAILPLEYRAPIETALVILFPNAG